MIFTFIGIFTFGNFTFGIISFGKSSWRLNRLDLTSVEPLAGLHYNYRLLSLPANMRLERK
jgi:hypothetical protein